jgi:ATP-dependent Clp protease ATP-binding subunit ClpA
MTAFDKYLRATIEQAGHEARADGSATIEAQHLLLAMAADPATDMGRLLTALGLDQPAIRAALEREFAHALSGAGVSLDAASLQRGKSANSPAGQVGPSVQHALQRGLDGLRQAPRPEHLLLGVLQAEVGTVPRALALAGFDRTALIARVQQALASG